MSPLPLRCYPQSTDNQIILQGGNGDKGLKITCRRKPGTFLCDYFEVTMDHCLPRMKLILIYFAFFSLIRIFAARYNDRNAEGQPDNTGTIR